MDGLKRGIVKKVKSLREDTKKQPLNLIPVSVFIPVFAIIPSGKIPEFHPTFAKSSILQNSKIMLLSSVFPFTKLHKIKLLQYCDRAFVCNKVG